jgi:anion-transporting  ArsA/GET3 family ATPase
MYKGFVERAQAVTRLLHDRRTTFLVVTTLEAAPLHEAEFFVSALAHERYHLGALVLNKVLPAYLLDPDAARVAERFCAEAPALAAQLGPEVADPALVARVLGEIGESFRNFGVVAKREAEQRAELASVPDVVATVPYFETDIYDLAGLLELGETIWK